MATVFKTFLNNDIKSTRTLLHEAIPITGAIVSGTYGVFPNDTNVKNYAHGMFQSVYDYPYLSSSANHLFDITVGYSASGSLSGAEGDRVQQPKKINIYNQMAGTLMGWDHTASAIRFDKDGNLGTTGDEINDAIFLNFSRLLQKDEIKKGSFTIKLGGGRSGGQDGLRTESILTITDAGADTNYRVNSAVGDYGILSCSVGGAFSGTAAQRSADAGKVGLIFYQAGVAVLSASIFVGAITAGQAGPVGALAQDCYMLDDDTQTNYTTISGALTGTSISGCCDAIRRRVYDISFNNTTELNSTIHFCRINNSEYNYSSNPTYLSSSKLVVKNTQLDAPVSYLTTVGLYSADNELLAVAKVSEPLKKDPTNEMTLRVRLDY